MGVNTDSKTWPLWEERGLQETGEGTREQDEDQEAGEDSVVPGEKKQKVLYWLDLLRRHKIPKERINKLLQL